MDTDTTNMDTQPTQTHNHTISPHSSGEDGNIKKAPLEPRGHTHTHTHTQHEMLTRNSGSSWVGKVLQKGQ